MLKAKLAGEVKVAQFKSGLSLLTVFWFPPAAVAVGSPVKTEVNKSKGKATAANKKKTAAAPKKPPAKKGLAKKSAAKQIQSDDEMSNADIEVSDEEQQHEVQGEPDLTQDEEGGTSQAGKGRKGTKRAAANKPGTVKAGNAAGTYTACQAR